MTTRDYSGLHCKNDFLGLLGITMDLGLQGNTMTAHATSNYTGLRGISTYDASGINRLLHDAINTILQSLLLRLRARAKLTYELGSFPWAPGAFGASVQSLQDSVEAEAGRRWDASPHVPRRSSNM